MSTATGTVIDKATAFKNSVTGANLNKIVCKSSSREMLGPKKKHVDCKLSVRELISTFESSEFMEWCVVFS